MGQKEFSNYFRKVSSDRESRLVLALDVEDWDFARAVVQACGNQLVAIKVHPEHALSWKIPHSELVEELQELSDDAPIILDAKLADIGNSNAFKSRLFFGEGYSAIICHGFPGEEAVQAVISEADKNGKGVFMLAGMTSAGHLFNDQNADALVEIAKKTGPAGVVAPGNQYELLSRIRSRLGPDAIILSPGIGAQGGDASLAFKAGADFAIVGRAIIQAPDPEAAAADLRKALNQSSR